ncbi:17815_t:CDS:2 [Funneliformis caledonium]|uniref:17815_t:CDS:1 n=1 Tax=Funneliformis caledonium TaxID=1117310 RepID=A0A9N8ZB88_9GLOM|nr:17815_t:CDS:2 [Funneliformis caledonium]
MRVTQSRQEDRCNNFKVLASLCCCCLAKNGVFKRFRKITHKIYQNSTDGGETGETNNISPPSYDTVPPAPETPHRFGKKHEATQTSFIDAKAYSIKHPPVEKLPTSEEIQKIITKGCYKSWKFIPEDIVSNSQRVIVSNDGRTIEFCKGNKEFKYNDVMIQTNYPFFMPDTIGSNSNEIESDIMHYFEITLQSKASRNTTIAIGISTKPYPYFRLPGWNANSVGYHSDDGRKFWNDEFGGRDYGPEWGKIGDIIGCGYKPKTGEVFFTKNGKFLGIAFAGLRHIWYPTIGSDGKVKIAINFGDEEFACKEAQGYGIGTPGKRVIEKGVVFSD